MGQDLRALIELLKALFSGEQLRQWVRLRFGQAVANDLPGAVVGLGQLAFDVAMTLERHGLVGPALFEALIEERPARRAEILALARDMGAAPRTGAGAGTGVGTGADARAGASASAGASTGASTGAGAGATTSAGAGATTSAGTGASAGARASGPHAGERGQVEAAPRGPVVRVLHLSDFHFRERTRWDSSTVLGRLAADVAGLVRDGLAPDLVVLTGDIAHGGQREEYAQARAWILEALLPAAGVGVDALVIAPGNHDVDRGRIGTVAPYIANGLRDARDEQRVTEVMTGEDGQVLLRRLDAFVRFANELGVLGGTLERPWYAVTREVRGVRVHCAALASAWLSADEGDHGKLVLGLWQCNEVLRGADDADVVIAALHHPWSYLAEWDATPCQAEIERSAGLVLRGHLHDQRYDYRQSPRHRGVLELAAGACYEDSQYPNGYHLIEIRLDAPEARRARVYPRYWDRGMREWRADLNVFGGPSGELPLRVRGR